MSYFMVLLMSLSLVSCASNPHQQSATPGQQEVGFDGQSISSFR